jgi:hypothetical protein
MRINGVDSRALHLPATAAGPAAAPAGPSRRLLGRSAVGVLASLALRGDRPRADPLQFEARLLQRYFGPKPEHSPLMHMHHSWHTASENLMRDGDYGRRFLTFHRQYLGMYDAFRARWGVPPVQPWNPATPIPAHLGHYFPLKDGDGQPNRRIDAEYIRPVPTPVWLADRPTAPDGPRDPYDLQDAGSRFGFSDPVNGRTHLADFRSAHELGVAMDPDDALTEKNNPGHDPTGTGFHASVHTELGGDMQSNMAPIDPIFWPWHCYIDRLFARWEQLQAADATLR